MKEIKAKILESIATKTYNKELTGDRVRIQNRINELQMLVDCTNELQPIESEFVLPDKWCVEDNETVSVWASKMFECSSKVSEDKYLCVEMKNDKPSNYSFKQKDKTTMYTEITFEQFKKYVLNERV